MAAANHVLLEMDDFGESREGLQEDWETWVHHIPFDSPVAAKLVRLTEERFNRLDPERDAGDIQRLERKLRLARSRAARYRRADFGSGL